MPLRDQHGEAFVAFTDISGFKALMRDERALYALNDFYNEGYNCLQYFPNIQGLFISDCGVIFTRNDISLREQFDELLNVIKRLNKSMLNHDIMLTTSIAYGKFSYHNRIEFDRIVKNPIYGNAYLTAYLDNENGSPKIQPGMCRITKKDLPNEIVEYIKYNNDPRLEETRNHFVFYWMCDDMYIDTFKNKYNDSYNMKYRGMLHSLKEAVGERSL